MSSAIDCKPRVVSPQLDRTARWSPTRPSSHTHIFGTSKLKRTSLTHTALAQVKNLPYEVTKEELYALFERFGGIGTLILPPTKTLALVQFLEAVDARRAFSACAYKRVGKVPIYLEWAPEGILGGGHKAGETSGAESDEEAEEPSHTTRRGGADGASAGRVEKAKASGKAAETKAAEATGKGESTSGEASGGATLYVKNLSFRTDTPTLLNHFKRLAKPGFLRAMVKTKPGKEGKADLSCGYGFVTYDTAANAKKAMAAVQVGSSPPPLPQAQAVSTAVLALSL